MVFQHVPVERYRQLIADVTGALVSDGFIIPAWRKRHPWPRASGPAIVRGQAPSATAAGASSSSLMT
ncbi:MAG: hypothetical protein ACRDND_14205 [Streptosporangiaceae bacterium]